MKKTVLLAGLMAFGLAFPKNNPLEQQVAELGKAYERSGYHGVVLLGNSHEILAGTSFGVANQESGRRNSLQTLFKTESTGKLFTATAILQLFEQGKLELKKSVADYLPESGLRNATKMTLHHLLTHQSGLTAPWEREGFEFRVYDPAEWWQLIVENPTAFEEPGSGVYYSSSAYEVLAAIVEKVSGLSFETYCQEHIFRPAGMVNTRYSMDTLELKRVAALPYRWTGSKNFVPYSLNTFTAGGAGGWYSTAQDFYKFARALMGNQLLAQSSLELMMATHVNLPPGEYGYGMQIINDMILPGKTVYGHNGGGMGYGADLFFEPATGLVVVGMFNMYGNSTRVSGNFMKLAAGLDPELPVWDKGRLLFDVLEERGLEGFATNYRAYLQAAGIEDIDERMLLTLGDNYDLLQRQADKLRYYEALSTVLPENCIVWMLLGDIAREEKNTSAARGHYEKALALAEKSDPYWMQVVRKKLSKL